jgi:putative phosphoesterase
MIPYTKSKKGLVMDSVSIGVLSDSHRKTTLTNEAINMLKSKGAQYLIHAGDLEIEENLEALEDSGLPYVSVFGNNDFALLFTDEKYNIYKEPHYFKIKEYSFKLMHLPYYLSGDTDVVVYGHTHQFDAELKNNTLFLNPGEICARNKNLSECALLKIDDNSFTVQYFFKKPNDSIWECKEFIYERE